MLNTDSLAPLRDGRVLIADHHAHTRTALREMVSTLGATAIFNAGNAADVVRMVKARPVDVILCDYALDGARDGQQLLEELRQQKLIPLSAIFVMITGERSYKRVVAVAEFAPDDYLIKPFTAQLLLERLTRIAEKKKAFARAYQLMEAGRADEARAECLRVKTAQPQYAPDALRLAADLLLGLKRHKEAQALLQEILTHKVVPWAQMGLARVHFAEKRLAAAEVTLTELSEQFPEYLGARDLMAEVKEAMGKPDEALEALEAAVAISSSNVGRLRRSAGLATAIGDHEKAGRLYAKLIERARDSSMGRAEDYISLANAYAAQGRTADAERVGAEQRRSMRGAPEAALVGKLMEYQRHTRGGASTEAARAALEAALEAYAPLAGTLTPALEFDLFNACCQEKRVEEAQSIGGALAARAGLEARILERVQAQLAQLAAEKKRAAAIVPLDQVLAMAARLLARGWDEAMGQACRASVAHWARTDAEAPLLDEAQERLAEVLRKYGMDDADTALVAARA